MAIALSIGISLIAGITFMFSTEYFWDKEDNPNINTINCTMTNISNSVGSIGLLGVIVLVVVLLAAVMLMCSCRGF